MRIYVTLLYDIYYDNVAPRIITQGEFVLFFALVDKCNNPSVQGPSGIKQSRYCMYVYSTNPGLEVFCKIYRFYSFPTFPDHVYSDIEHH